MLRPRNKRALQRKALHDTLTKSETSSVERQLRYTTILQTKDLYQSPIPCLNRASWLHQYSTSTHFNLGSADGWYPRPRFQHMHTTDSSRTSCTSWELASETPVVRSPRRSHPEGSIHLLLASNCGDCQSASSVCSPTCIVVVMAAHTVNGPWAFLGMTSCKKPGLLVPAVVESVSSFNEPIDRLLATNPDIEARYRSPLGAASYRRAIWMALCRILRDTFEKSCFCVCVQRLGRDFW